MQKTKVKKSTALEMPKSSKISILSPGYRLAKEHGCLVVRQGGRKIFQAPIIKTSLIVLSTRGVSISTDVISACAQENIPLFFLSPFGKVEAMVVNPETFRSHIALAQFEFLSNPRKAIPLAKAIVKGKIKNQLNLVKYFGKYRRRTNPDFWDKVKDYQDWVKALLIEANAVSTSLPLEEARSKFFGIEGRAATRYWEMVKVLVEHKVNFQGRERKGAKDLFNSMLNYAYGILYGLAHRAVLAAQLIPQIGVLHSIAPDRQKTPLVYDLVEEFRPFVADRAVISLLNQGAQLQVDSQGMLTLETRKRLFRRLHHGLASQVRHKNKTTTVEELLYLQAKSLALHFQGKNHYRPHIFKW